MSVCFKNEVLATAGKRETGTQAAESGRMKPQAACQGYCWRMCNPIYL